MLACWPAYLRHLREQEEGAGGSGQVEAGVAAGRGASPEQGLSSERAPSGSSGQRGVKRKQRGDGAAADGVEQKEPNRQQLVASGSISAASADPEGEGGAPRAGSDEGDTLLSGVQEAIRLLHLYTPAWKLALQQQQLPDAHQVGGAAAAGHSDDGVDVAWLQLRAWPVLLPLWDLVAAREAHCEWGAFVNESLAGQQQQGGGGSAPGSGGGRWRGSEHNGEGCALPLSYVRQAAEEALQLLGAGAADDVTLPGSAEDVDADAGCGMALSEEAVEVLLAAMEQEAVRHLAGRDWGRGWGL